MGFILKPEEAQALITKDPKNAEVIFPMLNGADLNSRPDQSPSRWAINFFEWPLEKAEEYSDCMAIVREKVYPQRMKQKREIRRRYWWRYGEPAPKLYQTIAPLNRVLAIALTSRTVAFAFMPADIVFSHAVGVFAFESASFFAVLQSTPHIEWAWKYGSTLKGDLRYTTSDIFQTFPFPHLTPEQRNTLDCIGETYHEHRGLLMLDRQEGLTQTYNRFHDPDESADDIARLRKLHVEMDRAVAAAYGWNDLDLGHGFHETPQGVRFTISEAARREVLTRLLRLNHERYAEEVRQGLHEKRGKKGGKTKKRTSKKAANKKADDRQMELF
jgi:hypothetical protein